MQESMPDRKKYKQIHKCTIHLRLKTSSCHLHIFTNTNTDRLYLQRVQCYQLRGENKTATGSFNRSQKKRLRTAQMSQSKYPKLIACKLYFFSSAQKPAASLKVSVFSTAPKRTSGPFYQCECIPVNKYMKVKCCALNLYISPYPFACLFSN